jgi:hypothetical protein
MVGVDLPSDFEAGAAAAAADTNDVVNNIAIRRFFIMDSLTNSLRTVKLKVMPSVAFKAPWNANTHQ